MTCVAALKAAIRFVILPDPPLAAHVSPECEGTGPSSVVHAAAATKSSDKTAALFFLLPRNSLMRLHLAGKKRFERKGWLQADRPADHSLLANKADRREVRSLDRSTVDRRSDTCHCGCGGDNA